MLDIHQVEDACSVTFGEGGGSEGVGPTEPRLGARGGLAVV